MKEKKSFRFIFVLSVFAVMLMVLASCGEKAQQPVEGEQTGKPQVPATQPGETATQPKQPGPSGGMQMQGKAGESAPPETFLTKLSPQTVVAKVNGAEIKAWLVKEVEKVHRQQIMKQLGTVPPDIEKSMPSTALDQAIKSELLYQQAVKEGIKIDQKLVDDDFKSVKMSFPNEQSFKDFLQAVGYGENELRTEIERRFVVNSYLKDKIALQVRVAEKDAKDYYDKNPEQFRAKELVRASYILFPFSEDTSEERKTLLKEQAQKVLQEARSGKDFAELAKKYSKAPNADKGGDLGYFPRGKMVSNFEKIVFSLPIGEISDLFETQFGYNILKVTDKKPEGMMPYDQIKMQIMDILMMKGLEEAIGKKLDALAKESKIEILVKEAQPS